MLKLFLAIFWVAVGVVFLVIENQPGYVNRTFIPVSWVAFLFGIYNLIRWAGPKWYKTLKKPADDPNAPPIRKKVIVPRREEPPNPDFDFTAQSPPRPDNERPG